MTELQARSCPWCHSIGLPLNGCKNIWHAENLADLQEARRVPIHEKVFATVGNVDPHEWSSADSAIADLAQNVRELTEENEGLRLQIEHLGLELAHAHLECGERSQDIAKVRELAQRRTDRHSNDSAVVRFAYEVLELTP